jgi:ATP-dependent RNA helicase DDX47/RRP3
MKKLNLIIIFMVDNHEKNKITKKHKVQNKKQVENEGDITLNINSLEKKIETFVEEQTLENKNFDSEIFAKETSFKELGVCDELCEILNSLNYKYPTKIQKETLQYTLKSKLQFILDKDVIGLAETGSGKTAAYSIPIIQSLLESPSPFYALILAPTRELCIQISQNLNALGAGIGLKTVTLVGGLNDVEQAIQISKNPHISIILLKSVIGSPGRVVYHLTSTKGFSLRNIKYLVFDEADKILDADFEDQVNKILENINKKRNTFLFSATMTTKVHKLEKASLVDPVKIEVNTK